MLLFAHPAAAAWFAFERRFLLMTIASLLLTEAPRSIIGLFVRDDKNCVYASKIFNRARILGEVFPDQLHFLDPNCVPELPKQFLEISAEDVESLFPKGSVAFYLASSGQECFDSIIASRIEGQEYLLYVENKLAYADTGDQTIDFESQVVPKVKLFFSKYREHANSTLLTI